MEAIQLKRKERPPIALISEGGQIIEKPTNLNILNEIELTVIPQLKICYHLITTEDEWINLETIGTALFVVMERLELLLNYISRGGAQSNDNERSSKAA
jgi:hypothetical protein